MPYTTVENVQLEAPPLWRRWIQKLIKILSSLKKLAREDKDGIEDLRLDLGKGDEDCLLGRTNTSKYRPFCVYSSNCYWMLVIESFQKPQISSNSYYRVMK